MHTKNDSFMPVSMYIFFLHKMCHLRVNNMFCSNLISIWLQFPGLSNQNLAFQLKLDFFILIQNQAHLIRIIFFIYPIKISVRKSETDGPVWNFWKTKIFLDKKSKFFMLTQNQTYFIEKSYFFILKQNSKEVFLYTHQNLADLVKEILKKNLKQMDWWETMKMNLKNPKKFLLKKTLIYFILTQNLTHLFQKMYFLYSPKTRLT